MKECIAKHRDLHVIVSNFRGCGKSTTLARLEARSFLYAWYPFRKVEFFSAATVENMIDPKKSAAYDRKRLLNTFVSCVVAFVLACAANAFFRWVRPRNVKPLNERDEEGGFLPLSTEAGLLVACFIGGFIAHRFRRRVLIFDDITGNNADVRDVQRILEWLRLMERRANVIFVTSNEALDQLMVDKSPTTRNFLQMPVLEPREMVGRLDRMGLPLEGSEDGQLRGLGQLTAMYGVELAYSARFHTLSRSIGMDFASPSRDQLWKLCKGLTLDANHPIAIAGSALVAIDRYESFPLGGCLTEAALQEKLAAPEYVRRAFPRLENAPHRLIIPLILLATTHVSNDPKGEVALLHEIRQALELGEVAHNGLYEHVRVLLRFLAKQRARAELDYFKSLLDARGATLLDDILNQHRFNDQSEYLCPMIFRDLRQSVLDMLSDAYTKENKDTFALEGAIIKFNSWMKQC